MDSPQLPQELVDGHPAYRSCKLGSLQAKVTDLYKKMLKLKRNKARELDAFLQEDFTPPVSKPSSSPRTTQDVAAVLKENRRLKRLQKCPEDAEKEVGMQNITNIEDKGDNIIAENSCIATDDDNEIVRLYLILYTICDQMPDTWCYLYHYDDDSVHDETYIPNVDSTDQYSDEFDSIQSDSRLGIASTAECTEKNDVENPGCTMMSSKTPAPNCSESDDKLEANPSCSSSPKLSSGGIYEQATSSRKEVAKIENALSEGKKKLLQKLRNMGNNIHNIKVLKANSGVLIASYRSKVKTDPNDYE
ncbi:hypothetical protein CAPTEDRAFT_203339 [Capitella teleta]|uniref:Uncharacterized protein n=1 Tax=Capitella teleta TaxID=283909 RepID=R7V974_CAPTE|nr:hypothetical protein CAPTEDRAFT_203339 [Capitella teleta]|eukprot:ELU15398.1 hypothetical protein CAPTEDRAFT_203339 [Capitella teleta]